MKINFKQVIDFIRSLFPKREKEGVELRVLPYVSFNDLKALEMEIYKSESIFPRQAETFYHIRAVRDGKKTDTVLRKVLRKINETRRLEFKSNTDSIVAGIIAIK